MLKYPVIRLLYWIVVSWLGGLTVLLLIAYLYSGNPANEPSLNDAIGFGGLLLMASFANILVIYLPLLWVYQKINAPNRNWLRALILVLVGNIPVYTMLMYQYRGRMSLPEAWLFLIGIISVAAFFGLFFRSGTISK